MLKRIFSIFAISLIVTGLFFEGYSLKCPVFADDTLDGWYDVTTNEQLVEAFKYYCKSRDVTIEGSIADGVTTFTTKTFNGICNALGIDITALQAELKYQTDGNAGLQFLFTRTGIDAYNRIFAQFLQDNELEVGDEDVNKLVYSGTYFIDNDDNTCLCYESSVIPDTDDSNITAIGTVYKYTGSDLKTLYDGGARLLTFNVNYPNSSTPITITNRMQKSGSYYQISTSSTSGNANTSYANFNDNSFYCILKASNSYYLCMYLPVANGYSYSRRFPNAIYPKSTSPININIVSNTINNNTYEGDTIINNEGDVINNNYPDNPDLPPSNPTIPDDGGWQDFELPSMPNDWLIYGMEKKFPFDIPFNIMFALSLLNHDPEIPKFEGDIDLKVCTWHYNIDLTPFDDIATILRRFEVLAFIIGLAILTKELIMWG